MIQKLFKRTLSSVNLALTDPDWPKKLAALRQRLEGTPAEDAFLAGIIGWLDANIRVELEAGTVAGLSNEEAQRFRGRVGMLLDLKRDLDRMAREARAASK